MPRLLARSSCWLLLVMMTMAPVASAAQAAAHLCCGELRIDLVKPCCCPSRARLGETGDQATLVAFQSSTSHRGCCELKAVARTPDAPTPLAAPVLLEVTPLEGAEPAIDVPIVALSVPPDFRAFRKAEGPERVTEAPLYLQLRQLLL